MSDLASQIVAASTFALIVAGMIVAAGGMSWLFFCVCWRELKRWRRRARLEAQIRHDAKLFRKIAGEPAEKPEDRARFTRL